MGGIPSSLEDLAGKQALSLLLSLLPGLIASEIIYALTVREKKEIVERVIQALVHTFAIYALWQGVVLLQETLAAYAWERIYGGSYVPSKSDSAGSFIGLALCALLWGLGAAWAVNTDCLHRLLQRLGVTASSSHPSQWYTAFYWTRGKRYIVVHLKDGRRLFGWPKLWPNDPKDGHLFMLEACWLRVDEDHEKNKPDRLTEILIDVTTVDCIEFVPLAEEPEDYDVSEPERQEACDAKQQGTGGEIEGRDELRPAGGSSSNPTTGPSETLGFNCKVGEKMSQALASPLS